MKRKPLRCRAALPVLLLLAGCGGSETPEDRVRAFVSTMADSAEQRRWRDFNTHVADRYGDEQGLDKPTVVAIAARYLLANQSVHVLERVPTVQVAFPVPLQATAVVYAAIAGQPIAQATDLARVKAEVYRFEIEVAENAAGALEVVQASWQPAPIAAFLVGD